MTAFRPGSDGFSIEEVRAGYDRAAAAYEAAFGDDLVSVPHDRAMVERASRGAPPGVAVDLGCGPGQAAALLRRDGRPTVAFDLSRPMLDIAVGSGRADSACQGDIRTLPFADSSVVLAVAIYVVQHVRRSEFPTVLGEIARVLHPGGRLLLATHLGTGQAVVDAVAGVAVAAFAGTFHALDEIEQWLQCAGFSVVEQRVRGSKPGEFASQRLYVTAVKPA